MSQKYRKQKKLNRTYLRMDQRAIEHLVELFMFVNNLNQNPDLALRGGIYKEIDKETVFTRSFDGWEVGYKLEDHDIFFRRKVFLKCEQPFSEVPEAQKDPILTTVFDIFLEKGMSLPDIEYINPFTIKVQQDVIPFVMTEKNPNLVSKGPLITKH